jgi:hypothetical protein
VTAPKAGALTGLRYTPKRVFVKCGGKGRELFSVFCYRLSVFFENVFFCFQIFKKKRQFWDVYRLQAGKKFFNSHFLKKQKNRKTLSVFKVLHYLCRPI